jgi:hypothetical protein
LVGIAVLVLIDRSVVILMFALAAPRSVLVRNRAELARAKASRSSQDANRTAYER